MSSLGVSISFGYLGGYPFVEWYRDDDGGSGYGDHAAVAHWFGRTMAECEQRSKRPPPKTGWGPIVSEDSEYARAEASFGEAP